MFLCGKSTGGLYINATEWRGQVQVSHLLNTRSLCVCPAQETEGSPRLTHIFIHGHTNACAHACHMIACSMLKLSWTLSLNRSDEAQKRKRRRWVGAHRRERGRSLHTSFQKQYFDWKVSHLDLLKAGLRLVPQLIFPLLPLWLPQTQPLALIETLYDDNHPAVTWILLQTTKGKQ